MKLINFSILYKPFAIFEEVVVQQAQCIKKIGQVRAKPNVSGLFARSPNLLIWLLEK
jgi:hypothetical protein